MEIPIKTQHTLPTEVTRAFGDISQDDRNNYIRALRRKGWTLQSIADAAGITRERTRQIAAKPANTEITRLPLPAPPTKIKPDPKPRTYVEPSPETLKRLLELQPYAQQVRGKASKYRTQAEEYTNLLYHAHTVEGVPLYRLALRLGVTHGALRFRLARYGLKEHEGTSRVYTRITEANRVKH